jgi:hypothetical protein
LDEALRAFQEELLTTLDVADVEERVHSGAQLARSMHAERQDNAQRRLKWTRPERVRSDRGSGPELHRCTSDLRPGPRLFLVAALVGLARMALAFLTLQVTGRRSGVE